MLLIHYFHTNISHSKHNTEIHASTPLLHYLEVIATIIVYSFLLVKSIKVIVKFISHLSLPSLEVIVKVVVYTSLP